MTEQLQFRPRASTERFPVVPPRTYYDNHYNTARGNRPTQPPAAVAVDYDRPGRAIIERKPREMKWVHNITQSDDNAATVKTLYARIKSHSNAYTVPTHSLPPRRETIRKIERARTTAELYGDRLGSHLTKYCVIVEALRRIDDFRNRPVA